MNKLNVRWRQYVWGPDTPPTLRGWCSFLPRVWPAGLCLLWGPVRVGAGLQLNLAKCKRNYAHRANSLPPLTYILKKIDKCVCGKKM